MLMVVVARMMLMVVVAMMLSMIVMNTSKGSLCKGEPVSWSKLLRDNHLVHHTNSKHCDALVTTMMTMIIAMLMTVTCSLESMARQVSTATQRIERTPTF